MGRSMIPGGGGYVELNSAGMRELLRSKPVVDGLADRMRRVQAALPGSELMVSYRGRTRGRVKVARGSDFEEANTGELSRALDLAGGQRGYKVKTRKPRARRG